MLASETLYQLIYLSRVNVPESDLEAEVRSILDVSRRNNPEVGITGALLFSAETFVQAVEGPVAAVEALFQKLQRDPRHTDFVVVSAQQITERKFSRWSMAYSGRSEDLRFADLRSGLATGKSDAMGMLMSGIVPVEA